MKRPVNQPNLQIQSLSETTSTKQQVLEKIQSEPLENLKAIIPDIPEHYNKAIIMENAEKILQGGQVPDFSDVVTESIIKTFGRPSMLIQAGLPVLNGDEVKKFKDLITNAENNLGLSSVIKAVGRIETDNLPDYTWVGTGWLFDDDLLFTNRHVAKIFTEKKGSSYNFRSFINKAVAPRIDFLAEYQSNAAAEFIITECLYISPDQAADVSVFRIRFDKPDDYSPLKLSELELKEREDIAVIGYPAYDSRINDLATMDRIYQHIYDVKRFAPGKVMKLYSEQGVGVHDASTLGGNSGSAVCSLESGKVLGLHFGGTEGIGNYFVTAPSLAKIIAQLPKSKPSHFFPTTATLQPGIEALLTEMVPRSCKLEKYLNVQVPSFKITGRMVAYASPDSTYAVTKQFFKQATESILIGIYDLSAAHMVILINDAIDRGVKVSLMLDIDSKKEQDIFDGLKRYGVTCVPAPSCASKEISYFSSSHEKVIVFDNHWTMIQSGNYSNNSIPFNEGDGQALTGFKTGNRDMGIAIESARLARFFKQILESDMRLELAAPTREALGIPLPETEFLIEAPAKRPDPLFPSQTFNFNHRVNIQPILSPDNYMSVIPDFLASAKTSIKIEQQYVRVNQPLIKKLLAAIPSGIEVQIIVAPPIGSAEKTLEEVRVMKETYGFQVCLLSKKHFVHCHNKLIIVDDEKVLISSQNWSDSAVSKNREAGVIIFEKEITAYYSKIFDADWTMSDTDISEGVDRAFSLSLESVSAQPGKFVRIEACDVQDV